VKIVIDVDPVPKPRMTSRDKWLKRSIVERYWQYKKDVRFSLLEIDPDFEMPSCNYHLIFIIAMPKSWSKKKQFEMDGKPHQNETADKDNLEKGFLDAVCSRDGYIWDGRVTKYWGKRGRIILEY
jgi:Holliday junction resolvase RusA-like endonuclease